MSTLKVNTIDSVTGSDISVGSSTDITLNYKKTKTSASASTNFLATNYIEAKSNGVTVYIPCSTVVW